jgi:hypothetical protein
VHSIGSVMSFFVSGRVLFSRFLDTLLCEFVDGTSEIRGEIFASLVRVSGEADKATESWIPLELYQKVSRLVKIL